DLAQVVAAGIGEDDDHQAFLVEIAGNVDGSLHRRAGRAAYEDALLPRDAPGHQKGVAVVDGDDPVDYFQVDRPRDEILTDALDLVRLRDIARVQRPYRVGPHRHHRRLLLFQETGDAGHGAPSPQAGHHHVNLTVGLRP